MTGLGLSVVAGRHFVRRWAFVRDSSVAQGVVVALREERDGMETQTFAYPRIRFRTTRGQEVTLSPGWPAPLWGATAVFTVLAVVFLSVGGGLLLGWIAEF